MKRFRAARLSPATRNGVLLCMGTVALIGTSSSVSAGDPTIATTGTNTGHVVALAEEKVPKKTDARKRTYPSLPGSVRELPASIRKNAPFDVESYFTPVPEENAAPLYLDALYEFSPDDMKTCISPAEHQARGAALHERFVRTMELMQKDQATFDPAIRAAIVEEYKEAFEKLATAQKRKRCVFDAGIGVDVLLPHAQSARQAVRLLNWRTEAALGNERIDVAIDNVEIGAPKVESCEIRIAHGSRATCERISRRSRPDNALFWPMSIEP
jgi:hypothetical protein